MGIAVAPPPQPRESLTPRALAGYCVSTPVAETGRQVNGVDCLLLRAFRPKCLWPRAEAWTVSSLEVSAWLQLGPHLPPEGLLGVPHLRCLSPQTHALGEAAALPRYLPSTQAPAQRSLWSLAGRPLVLQLP